MHDDLFIFSLKSSIVLALSTLIAWGDLLHYRISNRAVLLTLMMGLAWNASNALWIGAAMGLLGVLVGFVLLVPFYAMGGVTAGDVKWLAALGAWYGPRGIVGVFSRKQHSAGSILLGIDSLQVHRHGPTDTASRSCNGKQRDPGARLEQNWQQGTDR